MRRAFLVVLALSVLAVAARAEDDNPEPPGNGRAELRKLKGTWTVARFKLKGSERAYPRRTTYSFDGDTVTIESGGEKQVNKLRVDAKTKPPVLEMTRQDTKATTRRAFKIDKDELYLVVSSIKGANPKQDFSGNNGSVLVLTREKKKE